MEYLITFVPLSKSNYGLIVCDCYNIDINGMITLTNCLSNNSIVYKYYWYNSGNYLDFIISQFYYSQYYQQIIVYKDDIASITTIKENEIYDHIAKLNYDEAKIKAEKLEEQSLKEANEKQLEYQKKVQNDNPNINKTKRLNYLERLIRWVQM
jgi:hypothetical protein